jgi:hypothetical protein
MTRAQTVVSNGVATMSKSAKASAKVFEQGRVSAEQLLSAVDPLFAAQLRYDKELAKAEQLMRSGTLTASEFAKVQGGLKAQLDAASVGFGGVGKGAGNSRIAMMEMQHVARGAADQFAAGAPISQIFAQHLGMVAQAGSFAQGSLGKFGAFLGGPWGIAITLATVVLAKLVFSHKDAAESVDGLVDKMREQAKQAALNREADEAWKKTIEGVTESIRKRREEQERSLKTDIQTEQQALADARSELSSQQRNLQGLQRQLADAERTLASIQNEPRLAGSGGAASEGRLVDAQRRVADLRKQVSDILKSISDAQASVRGAEIPLLDRAVTDKLDPVQRATDDYTKALGRLHDELTAGSISEKTYETRLEAAKRKLDAVKDAAKGAGSAAHEFGKQISFADAEAIAKGAGLKVTSAFRSTAHQAELYNDPNVRKPGNPVARPGTSAHEGVNGKWALDIAFAPGLTPASLKKLYGDQGVSLSAIYKESGHFHIEGSRSQAAAEETAASRAQRDAVRAAQVSTKQSDDFSEARERLNGQILQAQTALARGIEAQAAAAEHQVTEEENKNKKAILDDLAEGKYGEATSAVAKARAEQLIQLNHAVAQAKLSNIGQQKIEALDEVAFRIADERSSREIDGLKFQDEMAVTQAEHRRVQLAILDAIYEQKLLELEHTKQLAIRNGATDQEIANIQAQIDSLPSERAQGTAQVVRNTRGPLEDYISKLPDTVSKFNEAVQTLEVQGINGLLDDITNLQGGFKSLLKSLLSTALQFAQGFGRLGLERGLAPLLGSLTGKGGVINLAGSIPSFASSLGSGGGGVVDLTGAQFASSFPHFARGGSMVLKGNMGLDRNLLSLNGVPMANVSYGERIDISPHANSDGPDGRRAPVNMTVITPNADSFNRSGRQVTRQLRRTLR